MWLIEVVSSYVASLGFLRWREVPAEVGIYEVALYTVSGYY